MRAVPVVLAILAMLGGSGCYRYVTRMPGVVDLRSDGAEAERIVDVKPAAAQHREGAVSIAIGHGAHSEAGRVDVEDRHFWLLGAVPVLNNSARDEVDAAVRSTGALRGVTFGEEIGPVDALFFLMGRMIPFGPYFTPSYTFRFAGDAIENPRAAPPPVAPTPPPVAPTPPPVETPPLVEPPPLLDPEAP